MRVSVVHDEGGEYVVVTQALPIFLPMGGRHSQETRNGHRFGWTLRRLAHRGLRRRIGQVVVRAFVYVPISDPVAERP